MTRPVFRELAAAFDLPGEFRTAAAFGNGHIHDTYRLAMHQNGTARHFVLQRINTRVFTHPVAVMENIARITGHLQRKNAGLPDAERRALRLVPARDGGHFFRDAHDGVWRV